MSSWKDFDWSKWRKENDQFDHESYDKEVQHFLREAQKSGDILDLLKCLHSPPPWKPTVEYNPEGDLLHVYLSEEAYYAKWVTPEISVLMISETDEIIGIEISGIKHLIGEKS